MALNTLTWQRCLANLVPSGTIEITENGEYDVAQYATADVSVSGGGSTYSVKCYEIIDGKPTEITSVVYVAEWENGYWSVDDGTSQLVTESAAGIVNGVIPPEGKDVVGVFSTLDESSPDYAEYICSRAGFFTMPAHDVSVLIDI